MNAWIHQAFMSLRRTPVLSAFMVLGLALSVGFYIVGSGARAAFHGAEVKDADRLFRVELRHELVFPADLQNGETWMFMERDNLLLRPADAEALFNAPLPAKKALSFTGCVALSSPGPGQDLEANFTSTGVFELFGLEVAQGRLWTEEEEKAAAPVVVLDPELAARWFEGRDPIGKTVTLAGRTLTVIGVLRRDRTRLELWELPWTHAPGVFVPHTLFAAFRSVPRYALIYGQVPKTFAEANSGNTTWANLWVRLDSEEERAGFTRVLEAQAQGRAAKLRPVSDWQQRIATPNAGFVLFELLSGIGLLVAAFGLSRLLVARFASRTSEIGLRCALGASRPSLFMGNLCEALAIGSFGALLGVAFGAVGLLSVNVLLPTVPVHFALDAGRALIGVGAALLVSGLAAIGPSWRFAKLTPAEALRRL